MDEVIEWLNDNAGAVQAMATRILVVIAGASFFLTLLVTAAARRQANANDLMAREMREQRFDMDRPYLLLEVIDIDSIEWIEVQSGSPDVDAAYPSSIACQLHNAGRGPAKDVVVTILQPLAHYQGEMIEVLMPDEMWETEIGLGTSFIAAIRDEEPQGLDVWAAAQGIRLHNESAYDCAIFAGYKDIHERSWVTFLRLGMIATTDNVRNVVISRGLVPFEHRIEALRSQS